MKLRMTEHSSDLFTFDASDSMFTAEASDLRDCHLERIYDDAYDVGLAMKSSKTGVVITYYMTGEHRRNDEDREITHWTYKPCSEDVRRHPECADTTIMVFND